MTWDVIVKPQTVDFRESLLDKGYIINVYGDLVLTTGYFPTGYAKSNPGEGFADFNAFYYQNPDYIKENWPKIYNFLDKFNKESSNP